MITFFTLSFWTMVICLTAGLFTAILSGFGAPIATWIILTLIGTGTAAMIATFLGLIFLQPGKKS